MALLSGCADGHPSGGSPVEAALPILAPAPQAGAPPDIVLLALEGVRADRPDALPDPFADTIRAFGPPSLRFAQAYATSAAGFASFGSLITGRYPSAIPLCCPREGASTEAGVRAWCTELPAERVTLPDILAAYGYYTAFLTTPDPGYDTFAARFQASQDINVHDGVVDAAGLASAASDWWASHSAAPRFLVVRLGANGTALDGTARTEGGLGPAASVQGAYVDALRGLEPALVALAAGLSQPTPLPPATDRDRLTVVASLYGTNLAETTGFPLWDMRDGGRPLLLERTLHVSLAIWDSRSDPRGGEPKGEGIVELTDVLPTLLARVGAVAPAGAVGRDLLSAVPDPTPWSYADFGDMISLRSGDYRLTLRSYAHDASSLDPALTAAAREGPRGRQWTLHDVAADPMQAHNLLSAPAANAPIPADARVAAHAAHAILVAVRTGVGAPPAASLTPERLWQLRLAPGQGYW